MATVTAEPRSRDAARTRRAILEAAQTVFANHSYAEAGVRDITKLAGVNPALVSRYFGGKRKLFEAALDDALDARLITDLERSTFGEQVVARFTEPSQSRVNPLPILLSGSSDADARKVALGLLRNRVFVPLKSWFGGREATVKAARFMIVSTGFFTYRDQLSLGEFAGDVDPALRRWLVSAFQSIVDD